MTATEELRRLLRERSVEWWPDTYYKDTNTCWRIDGFEWRASERDGKLLIGGTYTKYLTPEQAVDATVGRKTCHMVLKDDHEEYGEAFSIWWECDECGGVLPNPFGMPEIHYCPNCGRRVI